MQKIPQSPCLHGAGIWSSTESEVLWSPYLRGAGVWSGAMEQSALDLLNAWCRQLECHGRQRTLNLHTCVVQALGVAP